MNSRIESRNLGRTWPKLAAAAALFSVAVGAGWIYKKWAIRLPHRLIAQAYTQQRPFDYRIPGAAHGPIRLEKRGNNSAFARPARLLDAEARIAHELEKSPDDTDWLALRAQAELLAWDSESAMATLTRALDHKPDDADLMAETGIAYALRAESQNRPIDYGNATEYLGKALAAKPDHKEAIFNRTIVYERMSLFHEAEHDWRRYLKLDASGGWADEARRRLAEVQHKKEARRQALEKITADPAAFLRRIEQGDVVEPESYLDIAVTAWLPRRWEDAYLERALEKLASLFETRHRDRWLREMVSTPRNESLLPGLNALAQSLEANQGDQTEFALEKAKAAMAALKAANSRAGLLRAEAELIYALHRAYRPAECVEQAEKTHRASVEADYPWVAGQALLELGICRAILGDAGGARRDMAGALALVRSSGFPILELRATGIAAGNDTVAGNLLVSWDEGRKGLEKFWKGAYPAIRAHQIYFNIGRAAESLGLERTSYAFIKAGVSAIAETPHRLTEALGHSRLAQMAESAGWASEAAAEYDLAAALFTGLPQTKVTREYRAWTELGRASAELASGKTSNARARLNALGSKQDTLDSVLVKTKFYETEGKAHWKAGSRKEAESAFRAAVDLTERQLSSLQGFDKRSASLVAAGGSYRGLTELLWDRDRDAREAFRFWEWFRAGESSSSRPVLDLDQILLRLRRESVLSYAILPGGMALWFVDDRGVESRRLSVEPRDLGRVAERFVRLCAHPGSDWTTLRNDARQLYEWLVAPVAHRLDSGRVLVVIPDGMVAAVPMHALLDEGSRFLGERHPIVVAAGLVDYLRRSAGALLSQQSDALIVSNPTLGVAMLRAFPPLTQALRESEMIRSRFPNSVLLTEKQATVQAVKAHQSSAKLFHFSGHGFSNAGNGGLLLAAGEDSALGAGVLDGKELAGQDWSRCRLAVLSACSAGTGENRGPVNPESLVRHLLWAGVANVVASRWNVDAETTLRFMDRFYESLLSGAAVSEALRKAGERIRQNHETNHPYFWAGFQSFGSR